MLNPWPSYSKTPSWTGQIAPGRSGSRKVSDVPLLKGTRLPADTVLSNYEPGSPVEEISDNFDMPEQTICDLLTYAANKHKSCNHRCERLRKASVLCQVTYQPRVPPRRHRLA